MSTDAPIAIATIYGGTMHIMPLAVRGPFAVTPAVTIGGLWEDRYSVTHIESGMVVNRAVGIYKDGQRAYEWWYDLNAAIRFAELFAAALQPGDIVHDQDGWYASRRLRDVRDQLIDQVTMECST